MQSFACETAWFSGVTGTVTDPPVHSGPRLPSVRTREPEDTFTRTLAP